MTDFKFPANIKQIGSIGQGIKIYVEDYVCSYLQQYAESAGYNDVVAILLGKHRIIDGQEVLFVSGAIQGKYSEKHNDIMTFSDRSWEYILEKKQKFFSDLEILGWMQTQPSYGTFLNANYAAYHMEQFTAGYQVLFVSDPIEKVNAFYVYADDLSDVVETSGYFIYYDKNRNMHEYMLENKVMKDSQTANAMPKKMKVFHEPKPTPVFQHSENFLGAESIPKHPKKKAVAPDDTIRLDDILPPKKPYQKYEKSTFEQKRVINLLVSLCGVLFVICFIMGVSLIQNDDRITLLETDLKTLSTSYRNILTNGKDVAVFAAQPATPAPTTAPTSAPTTAPTSAANSHLKSASDLVQVDGNQVLAQQTSTTLENLLENVKEQPTKAVAPTTPEATPEAPAPTETAPVTSEAPTAKEEAVQASVQKPTIPEFYVVQKGDTLSYISVKFYGTKGMENKIMEANGLDNANKIYYGKKLKLPQLD